KFTLSPAAARAPVVTVLSLHDALPIYTVAASSLFTATDPDGDAITGYSFWNTGAGGGRFLLNGVALGINQRIDITAAQLGQLTYQAGSATDMLWLMESDCTLSSGWSTQ